ncbi:hypothetical protein P152DRAFT_458451 [Eremomyces bilateralis CBS 781.70]|uniref:Uncharacterized protein n=1 Tax=Eremomyces bilateralis CBS 781.70 TaxID=1392243 RepID=A0A6G1G3J6_9PEZI|nr:uncharacterized protein P152DRAFT_458451 [Eremomyces bilateralis CBS 781.70]KAF1812634.1 hypothetical protein P152DRAFT_458451 [Eremomyces bilateralis CBS 781.70]
MFGGDPSITTAVEIMNDTGSNIQTVLLIDLAALQYNPLTYLGDLGAYPIETANGIAYWQQIMIEMQIIKLDGTSITGWFEEVAAIFPGTGAQYRLSGDAMRNHLYFATAPGNATLFVAVKKNGLMSQLPIV